MTPEQIIDRIEFLSPTAWDGFRVRFYKGRKLLLQGTYDAIYDRAHIFVLLTKIHGRLPFDAEDEEYNRADVAIDLLSTTPDLELVLHHGGRSVPVRCGRIHYACVVPPPEQLTDIVDRCFALEDTYDYAAYFKVPGPLDAAEIARRIQGDEDLRRRRERRMESRARLSPGRS